MMLLSQYHIFELDTINIYSVLLERHHPWADFKGTVRPDIYKIYLELILLDTRLKRFIFFFPVRGFCLFTYRLCIFFGERKFQPTLAKFQFYFYLALCFRSKLFKRHTSCFRLENIARGNIANRTKKPLKILEGRKRRFTAPTCSMYCTALLFSFFLTCSTRQNLKKSHNCQGTVLGHFSLRDFSE